MEDLEYRVTQVILLCFPFSEQNLFMRTVRAGESKRERERGRVKDEKSNYTKKLIENNWCDVVEMGNMRRQKRKRGGRKGFRKK